MKAKLFTSIAICLLGASELQAQYNKELSNEIFEKHKGEILFSNEKIDLATYNEKNLLNSFNLLDELYAQIILKKTLAQSYEDNSYVYDFNNNKYTYNYAMLLSVDGEKEARWLMELNEMHFNHALTFDLVISTTNSHEKQQNSNFINEWASIVTALQEGNRKMKLEIVPITVDLVGADHPVIASGSFILNVQKDKADDYLELRTTNLPPATMINKPIEEKILKASKVIYPYATPLRAYITDIKDDWTYGTDEFGNIISRHVIASVVYRINTSNECWVKTGLYSQQHQGYGTFGPMIHYKETSGYYDYQIPCWRVDP